ncbi:MAG: hypothetical protein DME57_00370 [Verrucomicrobia bacterium]|nr:MAG: hypothetical protein DME57_00370 [Verrucomicrobiota bacterium]
MVESFKRNYPGTDGIPISVTQQAYADAVAFVNAAMTPATPTPPPPTPPPTATPKGKKKGGKKGKIITKIVPTPTPVMDAVPSFPVWQEFA